MVVVVAFVGLAVDVGGLRYSEHKLQMAADSAALAAALEVTPCQGTHACSAMQSAAQSALNENGYTGSSMVLNCASMTGSGLSLMLNDPPCFRGAADPNSGKSGYVEAVVGATAQTYFARLVGYNNVPLTARAEAMKTPNPNCIYALDPTGGNAISVDILANLSATCGVVDESSASNAFSCNILSGVHVTNLKITGGRQSFLCATNPSPRTGVAVPSPADPLAYLPTPTVSACGSSISSPYTGSPFPLLIVGNATLYPGQAYCGGIVILPTANVTFMPGTYVIRSGGLLGLQGGLSIDLGANVTGSGVTFYNYGPIGGVNFVASSVTLGTVSLTAPTSGTYGGILFFQDPGNTTPDVIAANSSWNTTLEGAYYFPTALVTCAVTGPAKYNILVAKDILFAALSFPMGSLNSTSFSNNYSALTNGSPLAGGGSVLVQ
jgi:hypothetical protein